MDEWIDFPCSGLWNNYYADRGLTTARHSTDPRRPCAMLDVPIVPFDQAAWDAHLGKLVNKILSARPPIPSPPPPRRLVSAPYRGAGHGA